MRFIISRYRHRIIALATIAACFLPTTSRAQTTLPADVTRKIDDATRAVLAGTGVPSASVAVVKDGQIAYVRAYGDARLQPQVPARPEMRYSVGSVSKQFTATAMLMLQEEGKLSLDDTVAKFLPDLARAKEVTIRQLLSHTSGYQDYWPQDYVPEFMLKPITTGKIMELWAEKPLDFDPGSRWQYSNTNYVIAGAIVEKVSGEKLLPFLNRRIFVPLGMKSVANIDQEELGTTDPAGYMRYALGPPRIAPKEGKGWLFAAGELAMTASDLAKWDISIIAQTLLHASSYKEFETEVVLTSGLGTDYGLGVDVTSEMGHRAIAHSGEVSGFTAQNVVYTDDRAAIVVLTNQDAARASAAIAHAIAPLLLASADSTASPRLEQARTIFVGLQRGAIDRSLFTDNANRYFTETALQDFAAGLSPLGAVREFTEISQALRGGMTLRVYRVKFRDKTLRVWTFAMPDGKLEQYQVAAME
jgi:D-alanyl-D-alanine carboxypeptidase